MSKQRAKTDGKLASRVERALSNLLEATQALTDRLAEDAPESVLDRAYGLRLEAFEALRQVTPAERLTTPNTARLLTRIQELDARLLADAQQLASSLRADRSTITRARHAISAHTAKERAEPRLVVVRA